MTQTNEPTSTPRLPTPLPLPLTLPFTLPFTLPNTSTLVLSLALVPHPHLGWHFRPRLHQADLRLVWLLSLFAIVPEAIELVLQPVQRATMAVPWLASPGQLGCKALGPGCSGGAPRPLRRQWHSASSHLQVRSLVHLNLGDAPSALPTSLTRWLLAALVLLDACIYLLARSLQTVVGWRYRVNRAGAAAHSLLLLLRASLRLDLLLLLPALLGTTVALFQGADRRPEISAEPSVVGATAGALASYAAFPPFLLLASFQLRRKAVIAAVPLGAAQLAWLIASSAVLLRSDDVAAGADGGGNRSATGVPGVSEFEGGLASDGLSQRFDYIKFFYALLVGFACVLRSVQLTLACSHLRSHDTHRKNSAEPFSALATEAERASLAGAAGEFARALAHEAVGCVIQAWLVPRVVNIY